MKTGITVHLLENKLFLQRNPLRTCQVNTFKTTEVTDTILLFTALSGQIGLQVSLPICC